MDIKQEFGFVPKDKSTHEFFERLQSENHFFQHFSNLSEYISFMNDSTDHNYDLKDKSMSVIIKKIQASKNKTAGFNLLTYLLAPGLQQILSQVAFDTDELMEDWLSLWAEFSNSLLEYPIELRPQKVAANLLHDTRHRILVLKKQEMARVAQTESIENFDHAIPSDTTSPYLKLAASLIEGIDSASLSDLDLDLVTASRVYGESMKDLANRLGLEYWAAFKRRERAEKHIREYWTDKTRNANPSD